VLAARRFEETGIKREEAHSDGSDLLSNKETEDLEKDDITDGRVSDSRPTFLEAKTEPFGNGEGDGRGGDRSSLENEREGKG
jgi:hypothetical protein